MKPLLLDAQRREQELLEQLNAVRSEIWMLDTAINRNTLDMETLQTVIDTVPGLCHPIRRCPDDILSIIFAAACDTNTDGYVVYDPTPVHISHGQQLGFSVSGMLEPTVLARELHKVYLRLAPWNTTALFGGEAGPFRTRRLILEGSRTSIGPHDDEWSIWYMAAILSEAIAGVEELRLITRGEEMRGDGDGSLGVSSIRCFEANGTIGPFPLINHLSGVVVLKIISAHIIVAANPNQVLLLPNLEHLEVRLSDWDTTFPGDFLSAPALTHVKLCDNRGTARHFSAFLSRHSSITKLGIWGIYKSVLLSVSKVARSVEDLAITMECWSDFISESTNDPPFRNLSILHLQSMEESGLDDALRFTRLRRNQANLRGGSPWVELRSLSFEWMKPSLKDQVLALRDEDIFYDAEIFCTDYEFQARWPVSM
ncbi:hypothetical protein FRC17_005910 [Serendipita sp. 399]|nr:hypothetical protein FRC17_005910 [Serendipita sp. 399]